MAIQDRTALYALIDANVGTNGVGAVTAALLRDVLDALVESGFNLDDDVGQLQRAAEIPAKTADYTIAPADAGRPLIANKATAIEFALPAVASDGNEAYLVRNIGAGDLTLNPNSTEQIEGATTRVYKQGEGALVYKNEGKTAWRTFDFGKEAKKDNNGSDFSSPATVASNLSLIRFASQTLTAAQQSQGRSNISAPLRGHIYGLTISNNVSDATNDVDTAAGEAASTETDPQLIVLSSSMTKRLDADWSAGSGNGGRYSGAAIANTTYDVFLVSKANGADPDIYLHPYGSSDATVLTHLQAESGGSAYAHVRYIGSILRVSGAIVPFTQTNDYFQINTPTLDISVVNGLTTSRRLDAIKVPLGRKVWADIRVRAYDASATALIIVQSPGEADVAPSNTVTPLLDGISLTGLEAVFNKRVLTDTSGRIAARASIATVDAYMVATLGWTDTRGRFG